MEAFLEEKGGNEVKGASRVGGGKDRVGDLGSGSRGEGGKKRWGEGRLDKVRINGSDGMEEGRGKFGYLAIEKGEEGGGKVRE